jgi:hypothetical protein
VNGKNNHSGIDAIQYIGIFQVWIRPVEIGQSIADLDFRRDGYKGKVKIEAQT